MLSHSDAWFHSVKATLSLYGNVAESDMQCWDVTFKKVIIVNSYFSKK